MPGDLLKIRDLSVFFPSPDGPRPAVSNVSFTVPDKRWVCLVGESGCGKTVTALSLTRLLTGAQVTGSVVWHDEGKTKELLTLPEAELRRIRGKDISYIFQDPHHSLNPVMTVGEQMVETYRTHHPKSGEAEAQKASMISLAEARLSEPRRVFQSFAHELSGGMK